MKFSRAMSLVPFLLALAVPGAALAKRVSVILNYGQTATLATQKTVAVLAECVQNDGGSDRVRVYATTTVANSYTDGVDDHPGNGTYLQPGDAPADSEIVSLSATTGAENVSNDIDEGWVLAPDGNFLTVEGETAILGVNAAGADCVVSVDIQKGSKFKTVK